MPAKEPTGTGASGSLGLTAPNLARASWGQTSKHLPQRTHLSVSTTQIMPGPPLMAPAGQTFMQAVQPWHFSGAQ